MTSGTQFDEDKISTATRTIAAPDSVLFELIADPARQPEWDGNANLSHADAGQRVTAVGQVFTMTTTNNNLRENHVIEFENGRRIAWSPAEPGGEPLGHVWRWELEPVDGSTTRVTHTYDWTNLRDPGRFERARATTPDRLAASIDRLAALAETSR